MSWTEKIAQFERLDIDVRRLLLRGAVLLFFGTSLASASLLNPNATLMHATEFSWLPAAGWVVLAVGILECFDAAIAKEARDFFANLPIGVLDIVVGGLTLFSISGHPSRLSLMIAAFLLSKGTLRMVIAYGTQSAHKGSTVIGAWVSIILGILVYAEWPSSAGWFLAFCLSADIGLRGWALMKLGLWLKAQQSLQAAA